MNVHLKTCFKCGQLKPISEFYRHKAMSDGVLGKCKDCAKIDVRQHRIANPEKVREYDRKRARRPERFEARLERNAKYIAENPEKKAAHTAVSNAVRDGRIVKMPCAFCGCDTNLEAHHHDYDKPLDVTWLCRPCHRRFHALERMATYRKGEG